MQIHNLTPKEWLKALGVGVAAAILLSALKLGISPLPKQLGLAFTENVLGRPLSQS